MQHIFTFFLFIALTAPGFGQSSRTELPSPGTAGSSTAFPGNFPSVFIPSQSTESAAPDYGSFIAAGDYYFRQKRYPEAIEQYDKALQQQAEQYPKDQILRAKALQAYEEREKAFRTAAQKSSEASRIPQSEFVSRVLSENHWKNAALVCDVTSSMNSYNNQLLSWLGNQLAAKDSSVMRIVLFNDLDHLSKSHHDPATAPGLYSFTPTTSNDAAERIREAAADCNGGDVSENNVLALLRAQQDAPACEQLIMINDNNVPWDFFLASRITRPVHIIVCGPPAALEVCYLNLARSTKGSVHFNGRSYTGLESYTEGGELAVDNTIYVIRGGEFARLR